MNKRKNALTIIVIVLIAVNFLTVRKEVKLNTAMENMDNCIETEFTWAKDNISYLLRKLQYTPELSESIAKFEMTSFYGYYFDGLSGGDDRWCILGQALSEINNEEAFNYISYGDLDVIAKFLDEHEYKNTPEITREDMDHVLEKIIAAAEKSLEN